jgi:hypothetical protein
MTIMRKLTARATPLLHPIWRDRPVVLAWPTLSKLIAPALPSGSRAMSVRS